MAHHSPQIAQRLTLQLRNAVESAYGPVAGRRSVIRLTSDGWILVRLLRPVGPCLVSTGLTRALRAPEVEELIKQLIGSD